MTIVVRKIKDHDKPHRPICAENLERARRRNSGHEIPLTPRDQEWTAVTIYDITCDLPPTTRLSLLVSAVGTMLAGIHPLGDRTLEDRKQEFDEFLRLVRERVEHPFQCRENRRVAKKSKNDKASELRLDWIVCKPFDIAIADAAFDRAFRRRSGEELVVTDKDVEGTFSVIIELMKGRDLIFLINMIGDLIAKEYEGIALDRAFIELERLILGMFEVTDMIFAPIDRPINRPLALLSG